MQRQFFGDTECERVLLCQMILDNKIIPEVNTYVRKESFTNREYALCYERIVQLFAGGTKIDEMLFMSEFREVSHDAKVSVFNAAASASNWKYYAGKVKECYVAREMQRLLLRAAEDIKPENAADTAVRTVSDINTVLSNTTETSIYKYVDMIPEWMMSLEERVRNKGAVLGTPTGLENLDEMLGGGIQDEYIFLGARPSIGKTALALQIANAMTAKKRVLFFELEMTRIGVTERAVSNASRIDIKSLRNGFLTQAKFMTLQSICEQLYANTNISFAFPKERGIQDIVATIRAQVVTDKINAVFIDHIGLIKPESRYHSTWEGVKEISNTLQMLQRELGIPIFTLIQLNREAERKDADLANISGSDTIVQDADLIMTLERKRQEDSTEGSIPASLNILKNRNGSCGTCHLTFLPNQVMFAVDNNPPKEAENA